MIAEEFGNQRWKRLAAEVLELSGPLPIVQIGYKAVMKRIEVNVGNKRLQVVAAFHLLSFEVFNK